MTNKLAYVITYRRDAAAAAHWLLNEFDPADFVTLITDTQEERVELAANAKTLGKLFHKMAKRQRDGDEFVARIPRDLARWFGDFSTWRRCAFRGMPWWPLAATCAVAATSRRGRKRINPDDALNRAKHGSDNERHRRRLKASSNRDRELAELMQRVGDSIIGGTF